MFADDDVSVFEYRLHFLEKGASFYHVRRFAKTFYEGLEAFRQLSESGCFAGGISHGAGRRIVARHQIVGNTVDPLQVEKTWTAVLLHASGRFRLAMMAFVGRCITKHSFGLAADKSFIAWTAASCPTIADRQINMPSGNFSKRSYWRSIASRARLEVF
jgi:hypothetical protein